MAVGSGLSSQLGIAVETGGFGVPTTTGMRFFEFNSESGKLEKARIVSNGLHAGGLSRRSSRTATPTRSAGGDFEVDVATSGFGLLWQWSIGSWTAAAPTQIGTSGVYTQVHKPGSHQGKSLTIQKTVADTAGTTHPFTYNGCKCTEWELSCDVGEFLKYKGTFDAVDERIPESTPTAGLAAATASYPTNSIFHFAQGSIQQGGTLSQTGGVWSVTGATDMVQIKSASVKQSNPMNTERWFFNTSGLKSEQIEDDFREGTGTIAGEFGSVARYLNFANDDELIIQLKFIGPIVGTSGSNHAELDILLGGVKLDGESPQVGGPDVVEMSSDFTWFEPAGGAPDIQITYVSVDSTI